MLDNEIVIHLAAIIFAYYAGVVNRQHGPGYDSPFRWKFFLAACTMMFVAGHMITW